MEIPTTKQLSQAERFAEGLRLLADECNMTKIEYNSLGIVLKYYFNDGSDIGCGRAHVEAGLIDRSKLNW